MPNKIIVGEIARRSGTRDDAGDSREKEWEVFRLDMISGQIIHMSIEEVWSSIESTVDIGTKYSNTSPGLLCYQIKPVEDQESLKWTVTASYKVPAKEQTPDDFDEFMEKSTGEGADDPTNPFGPEFSGGGQTVEEYWWTDLDNKPFLNSAGSAFQNVPAIPVTIQVDRVTVNQPSRANTAMQGAAAGQFLLASVSYQYAEHVNRKTGTRTRYYKNTFERWKHPYRSWANVYLLNMGFMEIKDGKLVPIKVDDPDNPGKKILVSEPRALSNAGAALAVGLRPTESVFRIRNKVSALGIPFLG